MVEVPGPDKRDSTVNPELEIPTRISADVGGLPCFLTFITMIPIDHKITSLLVVFCYKERMLTFGTCTPNY